MQRRRYQLKTDAQTITMSADGCLLDDHQSGDRTISR
jgi:hypothetical protein